ncbi:MAG: hypothetical protein CFE24_02485 [Flavobacterium sp. BFFFF2]|nr:MAG: hypothetical protein CFE24_02485 [Flavobacterium sp. BFFFF2]
MPHFTFSPYFILLFSLFGFGQHAVTTSGGDGSNTDGKVSYSIGQVFYQTEVNNTHTVSQGVQQPFEISVLQVDSNVKSSFQVAIYPNPTTQYVTLELKENQLDAFQFQLFDGSGKAISKESPIMQQQTPISFDSLPSGVYFVTIKNNNHPIQTFKIIKK